MIQIKERVLPKGLQSMKKCAVNSKDKNGALVGEEQIILLEEAIGFRNVYFRT